jgi:hypothetical protein
MADADWRDEPSDWVRSAANRLLNGVGDLTSMARRCLRSMATSDFGGRLPDLLRDARAAGGKSILAVGLALMVYLTVAVLAPVTAVHSLKEVLKTVLTDVDALISSPELRRKRLAMKIESIQANPVASSALKDNQSKRSANEFTVERLSAERNALDRTIRLLVTQFGFGLAPIVGLLMLKGKRRSSSSAYARASRTTVAGIAIYIGAVNPSILSSGTVLLYLGMFGLFVLVAYPQVLRATSLMLYAAMTLQVNMRLAWLIVGKEVWSDKKEGFDLLKATVAAIGMLLSVGLVGILGYLFMPGLLKWFVPQWHVLYRVSLACVLVSGLKGLFLIKFFMNRNFLNSLLFPILITSFVSFGTSWIIIRFGESLFMLLGGLSVIGAVTVLVSTWFKQAVRERELHAAVVEAQVRMTSAKSDPKAQRLLTSAEVVRGIGNMENGKQQRKVLVMLRSDYGSMGRGVSSGMFVPVDSQVREARSKLLDDLVAIETSIKSEAREVYSQLCHAIESELRQELA